MEHPSSLSTNKHASLQEELSSALPRGFRGRMRYLRTARKRCDPLFSPAPGLKPEATRLSSNFLVISVERPSESVGLATSRGEVAVLGIEVLIYTTQALTTIFVSKADSTGFLGQQRPSPIRAIASAFLLWLTRQEQTSHLERPVVVSLFARAQSQYLFPGSAENSGKHVLDDRQLIRWWSGVLDPLFALQNDRDPSANLRNLQGFITVPGYQGQAEMRPFLPPSRSPSGASPRWTAGHPLYELGQTRGIGRDAPPRCLLPRFPDDPKARFMQDLDDEVGLADDAASASAPKRASGKWKAISDLDRFWEAMEFRQECSSGRVVGFLWLLSRRAGESSSQSNGLVEQTSAEPARAVESQSSTASSVPAARASNSLPARAAAQTQNRKRLTGPIVPREPRLKGSSSSLSAGSAADEASADDGSGALTLSKDGYDKAMQTLLHLDFAHLAVAVQSTTKWVAEISSIAGAQSDFGHDLEGTLDVADSRPGGSSNGAPPVNDLGGMIRKKRKADGPDEARDAAGNGERASATSEPPAAVNMLGGGLVRKKSKVDASPVQDSSVASRIEQPAVNVLGGGLVRKKPKPAAL